MHEAFCFNRFTGPFLPHPMMTSCPVPLPDEAFSEDLSLPAAEEDYRRLVLHRSYAREYLQEEDELPPEDNYGFDFPTEIQSDSTFLDAETSAHTDTLPDQALPHEDSGCVFDLLPAETPVKERPAFKKRKQRHTEDQQDFTHLRTTWSNGARALTDPAGSINCMIPNSIPRDDFLELFSPPRLAPLLKARGFRSEVSVDILTGYDLTQDLVKREVNLMIEQRRPRVIFMSAPCTVFSRLMNINIAKMEPAKWKAQLATGRSFLDYSMHHAQRQLSQDSLG